jgi:hypothetical protein
MIKFISLGIVITFSIILAWWIFKVDESYPRRLLDNCLRIPISTAEKSDDFVAKYKIDEVDAKNVVEWYKKRGFSINEDSSGCFGYGPHGFSFTIYTTNTGLTLAVKAASIYKGINLVSSLKGE